MSKKNIFLLAAGYLAGGVVAALFNKKSDSDIKKELRASKKSGEGEFSVFVDNFIATHKNLLDTFTKEILSDKNKALLEGKKQDLLSVIESYKNEGSVLLEELKGKWAWFVSQTAENLEKLYEEKKWEISDLKGVAPEKLDELKTKLTQAYGELKAELKKKD